MNIFCKNSEGNDEMQCGVPGTPEHGHPMYGCVKFVFSHVMYVKGIFIFVVVQKSLTCLGNYCGQCCPCHGAFDVIVSACMQLNALYEKNT